MLADAVDADFAAVEVEAIGFPFDGAYAEGVVDFVDDFAVQFDGGGEVVEMGVSRSQSLGLPSWMVEVISLLCPAGMVTVSGLPAAPATPATAFSTETVAGLSDVLRTVVLISTVALSLETWGW